MLLNCPDTAAPNHIRNGGKPRLGLTHRLAALPARRTPPTSKGDLEYGVPVTALRAKSKHALAVALIVTPVFIALDVAGVDNTDMPLWALGPAIFLIVLALHLLWPDADD